MENGKVTRFFSITLLKQTIRTNRLLMIVVLLIMCMMSTVINYAASLMEPTEQMKAMQMMMEQKVDPSVLLNKMYYTVMGLLPIFIGIVIVANSLFAEQVDRGSMAFILSTPIKRSAIAITQAAFLLIAPLVVLGIVCASRIVTTSLFYGEVEPLRILVLYIGMYLLVQALAGICYFASCHFNLSRKSLAFGGGITIWCFIASLIGMFGTDDMIAMGIGVEELNLFNKLTFVGLYDVNAIQTIGTDAIDDAFVWKFAVLALVAVIGYVAGGIRFVKKDLPL